jgi:hypothetical protein
MVVPFLARLEKVVQAAHRRVAAAKFVRRLGQEAPPDDAFGAVVVSPVQSQAKCLVAFVPPEVHRDSQLIEDAFARHADAEWHLWDVLAKGVLVGGVLVRPESVQIHGRQPVVPVRLLDEGARHFGVLGIGVSAVGARGHRFAPRAALSQWGLLP